MPLFFIRRGILVLCVLALCVSGVLAQKKKVAYKVPRPSIGGLHIGMNMDSVETILRKIALRTNKFKLDSLTLIESDSVTIFAQPAYIRVELLHNKIRTIVVNFHPLSGERYVNTRDVLQDYLERFFGRGVITRDQSVVYRRWENEDGTMEVSFTDKYTRVFMRLGKWQ